MKKKLTNLLEKTRYLKTHLLVLLCLAGLGNVFGQSTTQGPNDCIKVTYVQGSGTPTVTYYQRLTGTGVGALNAVGGEAAGANNNRKVYTIELLWPDTDPRLTDQYTLDNPTTFSTANKDITIKTADEVGSPATIKRGSGMTGNVTMLALNIASGTLTFNNIVLDGMNIACVGSGAVLRVQNGTVNINSGAVLKNGITNGTTTNGNGGLVNVSGGTLNINSGAKLQNGTASVNGGLVNVSGGTLNINEGALLQDGVSSGNGGLVNVSGGALNINGATLQNGNAVNGAIINKAGAGALTITDSEINGGSTTSTLINIASGAGVITMTNTIINGQSATGTLISSSGTGAMTFTDCTINGSTTAADNTLVSKSNTGAVTFTNTTITRNQSQGYGFINTSTGTVTFDGCTIDGSNNTSATASLIKTNTGVLSLTNTTVTGHTVSAANICAVDASAADGGADIKIYTGTKIIGNTSNNRPANLKISGTNYMYIYNPLTQDIGITNTNHNYNDAQFGYSNPTTSIEVQHLINDITDMLTPTQSGHVIKWVADASADPLDDMFGFPDYLIHDLKTYPTTSDLEAVPEGALIGNNNEDPTLPYMVWKSVTYNADNSADITLNYFQKQVNLKLDFIFVIDETTTMGSSVSANGYTMSQARWARSAALEASKGVLQLNVDYPENNNNNRVCFISWGDSDRPIHISDFLDNYADASEAIDYDVIGGGDTDSHSRAITAATTTAAQSRNSGHQPIVVYLSDYHAYFDNVTDETITLLKEQAELIYPFCIFDTYNNERKRRMNRLAPENYHYYTVNSSDNPSELITPFIDIIHDAIAHCGNDLVVEDVLANGLVTAAAANGVTSSDGTGSYGTTNAVINDNGTETWQLLNDAADDNRLYTGRMYSKVINIPMTDDVYSGAMPTNNGLTLENDNVEVNSIPTSPKLSKPLTLVLKGGDASGAPLAGATFTLTHGSNTWNLTTDANGQLVLPWGENDVVGATTAESTFAFMPDDEYILTQTATIDGYVRPGGSWTLSVGSDYKITSTTTQGTGNVNRTLDMVAVSGKFEIYNDSEPTLTYVANGGEGSQIVVTIDFENNETSHAYTTLTAAESGFTYGDRTLTGWNTEGDGLGTSYGLGANVTLSRGEDENISLYAQWSGEPIIARVSNDNGATWTMHSYLINNNYDPSNDSPDQQGAFDYANTLSGNVIIETLLESHERYTLGSGFTFNGANLTGLTLKTTDDSEYNSTDFTTTISRGDDFGSLITFNKASATMSIQDITLDGNNSTYTCNTNGGLVNVANGTLVLANGSTLQNSTVDADHNGGGVYLASGGNLTVSGVVVVENNQKGTALNNVYLDDATNKYVTIGYKNQNLTRCSSIGITKTTDYTNDSNGASHTVIAHGAVEPANYCGWAFNNGFFFDDQNTYKIYTLTYGSDYSSDNLYFIDTWENHVSTAVAGTDFVLSDGFVTEVKTGIGMAYFAKDVNSGKDYSGKTVTLSNDIDLSGHYWVPVGTPYSVRCSLAGSAFSGTFDGQGKIISNMMSILPYSLGLFGEVNGGNITNTFVESGNLIGTYKDGGLMGGIVGSLYDGTITYSEAAVTMEQTTRQYVMGGLAGSASIGTSSSILIHSSMAMPVMNEGFYMGGLVGMMDNKGTIANCFVNAEMNKGSGTYAVGGIVGAHEEMADFTNCYVRLQGNLPDPSSFNRFGWLAGKPDGGTYSYCYIPEGKNQFGNGYSAQSVTNCGTYSPTNLLNNKYSYDQNDQKVGDTPLVDKLNAQATGDYARWTRTMASPINGDYPVLMMPDANCLGSKNGLFIYYDDNVNELWTEHGFNSATSGTMYLYDVQPTIDPATEPDAVNITNNTNVPLYIHENVGITQVAGNKLNARVGVTFDNSSTDFMDYDWHMFSTSLSDASLGIGYSTPAAGVGFGHQIADGDITLTAQGYYPANTPFASFDFYAYHEPSRHYINLKRDSDNHWHNATGVQIHYNNESTLTPGKGYMMAIDKETMLMADGVLNNDDVTTEELKYTTSEDEGDAKQTGINLIGNPYQSYLDFEMFAKDGGENDGLIRDKAYYILDADRGGYITYPDQASENPVYAPRYVHPHQGFFVAVDGATTLKFTNDMRSAEGSEYSYFRGEQVNYPLVNLICTDANGKCDLTTVEIDRPEVGGARKLMNMRSGDALLYAHFNNQNYQALFAPIGVHEIPVRLEVVKDGVYTITWSMYHGDFNYVHLIDNMTGADIDMLSTNEYRVKASTEDYVSRFRLVFDVTGVDEYDDDNTIGSNFAFFDGNAWVVTGEGTLQLFDVNGRCLYSTKAEGEQSSISLPKVATGVYMLRLTDNKNTQVQKVVVR